jgi:heme exporter protein A
VNAATEAVALKGVSKSFGPVRALVNVSLSFAPGAVTVIEGPNGSGKSTLLSIVGTLVRPTLGQIDFGSLGATREAVRARLGWLGHDLLVYGDLSGRENISLAAQLHGREPQRAVDSAVARFALAGFVERPVRTYSRGQRQRIALARSLVNQPDLLLLDEPTTGLDEAGVGLLARVVEEEQARGAIVVVVTHDAGFLADARRVRIERGRLQD